MKHSQNKPRRREPYHYDASGAQYIACIETALQHGQSIPVHVLQLVYHMLLPYLIFRLRFVRCLTWAEVADLLGDYYTEEGVCRMAYNYLAKTEKEKPTAQSA